MTKKKYYSMILLTSLMFNQTLDVLAVSTEIADATIESNSADQVLDSSLELDLLAVEDVSEEIDNITTSQTLPTTDAHIDSTTEPLQEIAETEESIVSEVEETSSSIEKEKIEESDILTPPVKETKEEIATQPEVFSTVIPIEEFESQTWLIELVESTTKKVVGESFTEADALTIKSINVEGQGVTGKIPVAIEYFKQLTSFNIMGNKFSGNLPNSFWDIKTLENIRMNDGNSIEGEIPAAIGEMSNLNLLWLHGNQFSGELPVELRKLEKISVINLANNNFSGTFFDKLGVKPELTSLIINNNQFSGEWLSLININMPKLSTLWINNNSFTGEIPGTLGLLVGLTSLRFNSNQFTGEIPKGISYLDQLTEIRGNNNRLSGEIPHEIAGLKKIKTLALNQNNLSGDMPVELWGLPELETLSLSNNSLTGHIFPDYDDETLGVGSKIHSIWLDNNQLTGNIPSAFKNLTKLKQLRLQNNRLVGRLPLTLLELHLDVFNVSNNQVTIDVDINEWADDVGEFTYSNTFIGTNAGHLRLTTQASYYQADAEGFIHPVRDWGLAIKNSNEVTQSFYEDQYIEILDLSTNEAVYFDYVNYLDEDFKFEPNSGNTKGYKVTIGRAPNNPNNWVMIPYINDIKLTIPSVLDFGTQYISHKDEQYSLVTDDSIKISSQSSFPNSWKLSAKMNQSFTSQDDEKHLLNGTISIFDDELLTAKEKRLVKQGIGSQTISLKEDLNMQLKVKGAGAKATTYKAEIEWIIEDTP